MVTENRYRLNTPTVISECLDGEVVVINLDTGCYYSLRRAGALAFDLLVSGATIQEASAALEARCPSTGAGPIAALQSLVTELVSEGLVVSRDSACPDPVAPGAVLVTLDSQDGIELERFTDMQDLLQMDPIHEVKPEGWPVRSGKP